MLRRTLLIAAAGLASGPTMARQTAGRTPGQIVGPYYPLVKPAEQDADLTVLGDGRRAGGQVVRLTGRVSDQQGRPLAGARIEIWQADAGGRYAHPSDPRSSGFDATFQGYAALITDADGRYAFTTIKPGAYPDDGAGGYRAPHIHFDVQGRANRLATQMYFPGEPLNDTDRVLAFAGGNGGRLVAEITAGGDGDAALDARWDIVLRGD